MDIPADFQFTSVSGTVIAPSTPLGALAQLVGTWKGHGFNQVWRPMPQVSGSDHFLELNETNETLQFAVIPGDIPNRGLLQADINLSGITYLQHVQDANVLGPNGRPAGIHVEPGIWIKIPATTNPQDPETVARLANIPHGTSFVAQGAELSAIPSAPAPFPAASITPFAIGNPGNLVPFPQESTLTNPSNFRTPLADIPHVTQQMVDNPNVFLSQTANLAHVTSTTTLKISTTVVSALLPAPPPPPSSGGGTSNIAFLQGATGGQPNAVAAQLDATFWIETVKKGLVTTHQLQYTQRVLLNFAGLSWPHVSVATLIKQ